MNINNLLLLLSILTTALTWANEEVEAGENEIDLIAGPVSCEYKSKDLYEEYNVDNDIVIKCSEGSCSINDDNVGAVTSPGFVNITSSGTYIIQGSLEGQVFIDADKDEFVHLVLVDTTISSSNGPAIYGANADKITISIIGNNTLIDTSDYSSLNNEKKPNACLFVDSDLSINGSGSLIVTGNYANAIQSKKDLKLVNASISVPYAVKKGIKAKNSLCVKNANLDVTSTDSALMVTKKDNAEKGYIVIDGGKINISTRNDGIHAETHLTIKDGYIDIDEFYRQLSKLPLSKKYTKKQIELFYTFFDEYNNGKVDINIFKNKIRIFKDDMRLNNENGYMGNSTIENLILTEISKYYMKNQHLCDTEFFSI